MIEIGLYHMEIDYSIYVKIKIWHVRLYPLESIRPQICCAFRASPGSGLFIDLSCISLLHLCLKIGNQRRMKTQYRACLFLLDHVMAWILGLPSEICSFLVQVDNWLSFEEPCCQGDSFSKRPGSVPSYALLK